MAVVLPGQLLVALAVTVVLAVDVAVAVTVAAAVTVALAAARAHLLQIETRPIRIKCEKMIVAFRSF